MIGFDNDKKIGKEEMIRYLKMIDEKLGVKNEKGEILISGGASICLVHGARDSTKDIDALFEPKNTIHHIAKNIAEDNGLTKGWLNDGVKGFFHEDMPKESIF